MTHENRENLIARALVAWHRTGRTDPVSPELIQFEGRWYLTLRDDTGSPVVVYRVRPNDGRLRAMKRPPVEVTGEVS